MEQEELKNKKQMLLAFMKENTYRPMKLKELAGFFQISKQNREELKQVINCLLAEGMIAVDEKGRYRIEGSEKKKGTFCGTSRGFGFVSIEGMEEDIFIPESETNGALDGDIVQVLLLEESTGPRKEGKVLAVLERTCNEVVGTFEARKNFGFVIPDNLKLGEIFILQKSIYRVQ